MLHKLKEWFYNTFPKFKPEQPKPHIEPVIDESKVYAVTKDEVDRKNELYNRIASGLDEALKREEETGIRVGDPFVTTSGPVVPKTGDHKYNHARTKDGYGVCRCGTRENTDESLLPCTAPKPKNRNKKRKNKRKNRGKKQR